MTNFESAIKETREIREAMKREQESLRLEKPARIALEALDEVIETIKRIMVTDKYRAEYKAKVHELRKKILDLQMELQKFN